MIIKGENDIHQQSNGEITTRAKCFNEIDRNYPEAEAIRIGLNTTRSGEFAARLKEETAKKIAPEEHKSLLDEFQL